MIGEQPNFLGPLIGDLNEGSPPQNSRWISIGRVGKNGRGFSPPSTSPAPSVYIPTPTDWMRIWCLEETNEILHGGIVKYDDSDAKRTSRTVNGQTTIVDDFKPNAMHNEVYKSACLGEKPATWSSPMKQCAPRPQKR
mmetsp:Transcript_14454/g.23917  ORF Transcript_14454/g.23917 Transcript_14454/m.23917 type:complete len:138 (-) Transcript_14454:719-1132(-)